MGDFTILFILALSVPLGYIVLVASVAAAQLDRPTRRATTSGVATGVTERLEAR